MADQKDGISWCDETWNPTRGCQRVSDGCRNCWAERMAARLAGRGRPYDGLVHPARPARPEFGSNAAPPRWTGRARFVPEMLERPLRWRKPRRIAVSLMGDLFHEDITFEQIAAVFGVMAATPRHTYLLLTKRPARMLEFYRWVAKRADDGKTRDELKIRSGFFPDDVEWRIDQFLVVSATRQGVSFAGKADPRRASWPLSNVMDLQDRVMALSGVPAAKKYLSLEPLLEPVDLDPPWCQDCGGWDMWAAEDGTPYCPECESEMCYGAILDPCAEDNGTGVSFVIVGVESGPRARYCSPDNVRSVVEQCLRARVPVHVKQVHLGGEPTGNFRTHNGKSQFEVTARLSKDPREWPPELRVRQWPEVVPRVP